MHTYLLTKLNEPLLDKFGKPHTLADDRIKNEDGSSGSRVPSIREWLWLMAEINMKGDKTEQKLERFHVSVKLYNAKDSVRLTQSEIALIKESAGLQSVPLCGAIHAYFSALKPEESK